MSKLLKRQGDILLERIANDLDELGIGQSTIRVVEDRVIARGEVTGHAHVLEGAPLLETPRGQLAVVSPQQEAEVRHDEHDALELEPGVWLVRHQIEYGGDGQNVAVYD